jgi:hypothetical protein
MTRKHAVAVLACILLVAVSADFTQAECVPFIRTESAPEFPGVFLVFAAPGHDRTAAGLVNGYEKDGMKFTPESKWLRDEHHRTESVLTGDSGTDDMDRY